jgi:hypothetical protein
MAKNWLALSLAVTLFLIFMDSVSADQLYQVLRVVDGDTVEIDYNGQKENPKYLEFEVSRF